MRRSVFVLTAILVAAPLHIFTSISNTSAAPILADPAFSRVWERMDEPVVGGGVARSWFWGPEPVTGGRWERYIESPGNERLVQYLDKGRMEIIDPAGDSSASWYVTSGLLSRELISGRVQIGETRFLDTGAGAGVAVAGDPDNPFPTYADLNRVVDQGQPDRTGDFATTVLLPDGASNRADAANDPLARLAYYVSYTGPFGSPVGYNIPEAFWRFMNQSGEISVNGERQLASPLFDWLYVFGYPISDPVWVQVRVGGAMQWVLVQPFERRVLTYTPANASAWQVEMGNVGQHYYRWRYQWLPPVDVTGDQNFFAFHDANEWHYTTSAGLDEIWQIDGISRSFAGGSNLIRRLEYRWDGRQVSYWSLTDTGLHLYGTERLNENGDVTSSSAYWPPLPFMPAPDFEAGQSWTASTREISSTGPPRELEFTFTIAGWQRVSTPAGFYYGWKLTIEERPAGSPDAQPVSTVYSFTPRTGIVQWISNGFAAQLKSLNFDDSN